MYRQAARGRGRPSSLAVSSAARPVESLGTTTSPSPSASASRSTREPRSLSQKGTASRSSSNVRQCCRPGQRSMPIWSRRRRKTTGLSSSPGNSSALSMRPWRRTYVGSPLAAATRASSRVRCGAAESSLPRRQPRPLERSSTQPRTPRASPERTSSGPIIGCRGRRGSHAATRRNLPHDVGRDAIVAVSRFLGPFGSCPTVGRPCGPGQWPVRRWWCLQAPPRPPVVHTAAAPRGRPPLTGAGCGHSVGRGARRRRHSSSGPAGWPAARPRR